MSASSEKNKQKRRKRGSNQNGKDKARRKHRIKDGKDFPGCQLRDRYKTKVGNFVRAITRLPWVNGKQLFSNKDMIHALETAYPMFVLKEKDLKLTMDSREYVQGRNENADLLLFEERKAEFDLLSEEQKREKRKLFRQRVRAQEEDDEEEQEPACDDPQPGVVVDHSNTDGAAVVVLIEDGAGGDDRVSKELREHKRDPMALAQTIVALRDELHSARQRHTNQEGDSVSDFLNKLNFSDDEEDKDLAGQEQGGSSSFDTSSLASSSFSENKVLVTDGGCCEEDKKEMNGKPLFLGEDAASPVLTPPRAPCSPAPSLVVVFKHDEFEVSLPVPMTCGGGPDDEENNEITMCNAAGKTLFDHACQLNGGLGGAFRFSQDIVQKVTGENPSMVLQFQIGQENRPETVFGQTAFFEAKLQDLWDRFSNQPDLLLADGAGGTQDGHSSSSSSPPCLMISVHAVDRVVPLNNKTSLSPLPFFWSSTQKKKNFDKTMTSSSSSPPP